MRGDEMQTIARSMLGNSAKVNYIYLIQGLEYFQR